jgi:P27 family predicted phage terminase small subunit
MPAGRPRKTDAQKKLEGTFRKDRSAAGSLSFTSITKVPAAPEGFDDLAKDVWNTICGELIQKKIMEAIDIYNIQVICKNMSIYWDCLKEMGNQYIVDTGTGSTKTNPLFTTANQAFAIADRLGSRYGFSPTDRMKLKMINPSEKPKGNPALELMNRKKTLK